MASTQALAVDPHMASTSVARLFDAACEFIAPTWPLDRMIAVNPFWELRHLKAGEVAARVSALARSRPLMPPDFYAALDNPSVADRHLAAAAAELGVQENVVRIRADRACEDAAGHWHNVSDLLDSERDGQRQMAWHDEIVHQISQFCAACFQAGGDCADGALGGTLYQLWLDAARADRGIPIIMGEPALRAQFESLPDDREALLAAASSELDVGETAAELYAHALLLDINGWASWVAYLRWQARLAGGDSDLMKDLLAIRMAWDLVLWRHVAARSGGAFRRLQYLWQHQLAAPAALVETHRAGQRRFWLWLRAAELAYQEQLQRRILRPPVELAYQEELRRRVLRFSLDSEDVTPALQAVFCIDVRSEVVRRHLEAQSPSIQTLGFAGFFGLPLEYRLPGTQLARPQLPGLLAPSLRVRARASEKALAGAHARVRWSALGDAPPAMFALVESSGPLYAFKLLKETFFPGAHRHPVDDLDQEGPLELCRGDMPLGLDERAELAATVLHALGLEEGFARVVLLVGHGSTSRNNPHAASLDCGACGGQTGALNARVLAMLLNDRDVRRGLSERGIKVPEETRFLAMLHDTTTDDMRTLDGAELPPMVAGWLSKASGGARRERAERLGTSADFDFELAGILSRRGLDWSQVRPEWGLADNAAFIAAPRKRTRHANLEGRVFLHDYDWRKDHDFSVLELIMTAPMVVAHWINMQYNASTTDDLRYGSGNKVLHNVVGGHIGVFEGNGGDLRIGLPLQSLHDGRRWMHTPLRLSVYLQAPAAAIADVYRRSDVVRQLVDNDWLYLFRIGDDDTCDRLYRNEWAPVKPAASSQAWRLEAPLELA